MLATSTSTMTLMPRTLNQTPAFPRKRQLQSRRRPDLGRTTTVLLPTATCRTRPTNAPSRHASRRPLLLRNLPPMPVPPSMLPLRLPTCPCPSSHPSLYRQLRPTTRSKPNSTPSPRSSMLLRRLSMLLFRLPCQEKDLHSTYSSMPIGKSVPTRAHPL